MTFVARDPEPFTELSPLPLTYHEVLRYCAFSVLVGVQARDPQDAVDRVCNHEGNWFLYEPRYEMQLGLPEPDGSLATERRYQPHINDCKAGPGWNQTFATQFKTTFQALVDAVKELDQTQWEQLLAERVLVGALDL